MTTTPANRTPFLRTQRNFPQEIQPLTVEISRSYLEIANAVNDRTIGVFSKSSVVTGNAWYITSSKKQTQRQVYTFTAAGNIPHGISLTNSTQIVAISGTFNDGIIPAMGTGPTWYPLPYVDTTAANQVSIWVDYKNIVITAGAGAPTIASGYVILEWFNN